MMRGWDLNPHHRRDITRKLLFFLFFSARAYFRDVLKFEDAAKNP
jgi:hypothetical protein